MTVAETRVTPEHACSGWAAYCAAARAAGKEQTERTPATRGDDEDRGDNHGR
jgi:hypothetical protein